MIYANMRGRLGNQLFIYATARCLQVKTGQDLTLNYTSYRKHYESDSMDLSMFFIPENIILENRKKLPWFSTTDSLVIKSLRHYFPDNMYKYLMSKNVFLWLGEEYQKIFYDDKKDIFLDGYWQSSKYFDDIRDILLKELRPRITLSEKCRKLSEIIKNNNAVCVSVRRGDYVTNPQNKAIYYICDKDYIDKSIKKMQSIVSEIIWIVFSDDINWVKENISFSGTVYYQPEGITPLETMNLMSECKHFILSNSSFSWWGQYLSNYREKVVIAPSKWYVDNRKADIIESSWVKIPV